MRHFADGQFTASAFREAEIAAKAVLDEALNAYGRDTWDVAYGSSGTIGAVGDVLAAAGWPDGTVTREGLDWLLEQLLAARQADRVRLDGLKEDRRAVIGGGLSVLRALVDLLGIDSLQAAQGALRHGVLYDLLDREAAQTDVRSTTVQRLARKFAVDNAQANRVTKVACTLFKQLRVGDDPSVLERIQRKLQWAAQLHEIGLIVSHSDGHKHGAYILDNADAPGFALPEMHRLSLLVLGHRGKLRKLDADFADEVFVHQLLTLRLAVILCHARREPDLKGMALQSDGAARRITLSCRPDWAIAFPQSAHLLREEVLAWAKTSWCLEVM
jgi:exopolyphosphatase/guanosine-5'-triphosphate,3'-diphosphate pyrophosphatase